MAENRTFRFYGIGYGSTDATITAEVNGVEVYSGPVPTIDAPIVLPATDTHQLLFSIEDSAEYNTAFAGMVPASVTVTGGSGVIFGEVLSNWAVLHNPAFTDEQFAVLGNPDSTQEERVAVYVAAANPPLSSAEEAFLLTFDPTDPIQLAEAEDILALHNLQSLVTGPEYWNNCYNGDPVNSEETIDTRSSVQINGVTQVPPLEKSTGTWNWLVINGSTLSYNWNIGSSEIPLNLTL